MTQVVLFYVYAAVAVAGAVGLVSARRLVHAVVSMFATLVAIAALYLNIGSEFIAAMQLFVYGGAVTVLVMFVLMLTRQGAAEQGAEEAAEKQSRPIVRWAATFLCLSLFGVLVFTFAGATFDLATEVPHTTASLASILFSRYVLPFEIAGLSLTIALIGAIVLAREDDVVGMPSEAVLVAEGQLEPAVGGSSATEPRKAGERT